MPLLLWISAVICTASVLSNFYNAVSAVNLLSDGYDLLSSLGQTPDFERPRLGVAWMFLIPGSCACLFAAAMTVEKWGLETWAERIFNNNGETAESSRISCPQCAEMILPQAKLCRHCGAKLKGES